MEALKQFIMEVPAYVAGGDPDLMLSALEDTGEPGHDYPEEIQTILEYFGDFFFGPPGVCSTHLWRDQAESNYNALKELLEH